ALFWRWVMALRSPVSPVSPAALLWLSPSFGWTARCGASPWIAETGPLTGDPAGAVSCGAAVATPTAAEPNTTTYEMSRTTRMSSLWLACPPVGNRPLGQVLLHPPNGPDCLAGLVRKAQCTSKAQRTSRIAGGDQPDALPV